MTMNLAWKGCLLRKAPAAFQPAESPGDLPQLLAPFYKHYIDLRNLDLLQPD